MEDNVLDQPASQEGEYNFDEKVGQLLASGYEFKLGEYISTAHRIVMKEMGSFIGFLLLLVVIYGVLAFIPFVGSIANFIISYPLFMGFAIFARRIFYNKPHQFSNFFDGFKLIGPLVLLRLLVTLIILVIVIPYIFIALWPLFKEIFPAIMSGDTSDIDPYFVISQVTKLIPLIFLALFGQALFTLAPFITVFGRKGVWESLTISVKLVWKRFLYFILFFIVLFFINVGGMLLLVVGLLYTVPLSVCATYIAYEMIVGTRLHDELLDGSVA